MKLPRIPLGDFIGLAFALILLIGVFGIQAKHFLTTTTFQTIANQIPEAILIAVGMTGVLLVGGIDLSVGSVLALSGAMLGVCMSVWGLPLPVAVLTCLGTGLLCGLVNGLVVLRWSLPPFIVTLGMLEAARGMAYLVTGSRTVYLGAKVEGIAQTGILGLSAPFLIAVVVTLIAQTILSRTVFGRYCVAVGTNADASWLAGIDPKRIRLIVYASSGVMAAAAAVAQVSRLGAADPNAGSGAELQAIAAVVIGGTSLLGGRGSVVASFFGVLIIAVLENGLAQIGAQEPVKRLVTGLVIVLAVILDRYRHRNSDASEMSARSL